MSQSQCELANRVRSVGGFKPDERISIWSEITLRDSSEGSGQFNYRLDYVLRSTRENAPPVIVEVMTCSTSGGNRSLGTDIRGAFRSVVVSAHTVDWR